MIPDTIAALIRPMAPVPTALRAQGALKRPVRAVLFDVYGTLFISGAGDIGIASAGYAQNPDLAARLSALNVSMSAQQLQERLLRHIAASHAEGRRRSVTHPEVDIVAIWKSVLGPRPDEDIRQIAMAYELAVNPVYPMPGLRRLLRACRSAGRVMGIVSNAQFYTALLFEWFLDAVPTRLGFTERLLIYSFEMGMAKPEPALFREAAHRLSAMGIAAENTLYMGNDMRNDIRPAHACGFQTALFAGDNRSLRLRGLDPAALSGMPDVIVTGLQQVPAMLAAADRTENHH